MAVNLRGRSLLTGLDCTPDEWRFLLGLAAELKRAKLLGAEVPRLHGKNLVLVREPPSTGISRAGEIAAHDQGAEVTDLAQLSLRLGDGAPDGTVAEVLGRWFDGIECHGLAQDRLETIDRHAGVPVWNAMSDEWCPAPTLGDMLTMREHTAKPDEDVAFAYCGDGRSSLGNSLLVAGAMLGMDVRMVAPRACWSREEVAREARRTGEAAGARITHTDDLGEGVRGVDFLLTDRWLHARWPVETWNARIALLAPYRVTMDVVRATGNRAVKVMHPLPVAHRRGTSLGRRVVERTGVQALEISDEVFDSPNSIMFEQAENRVHATKAVMVATLGG